MGFQLLGKGQRPLLCAGWRALCGKITVTGIPDHLNYFVIFLWCVNNLQKWPRAAGCRPMIWAMPYRRWEVGKLHMNMGH